MNMSFLSSNQQFLLRLHTCERWQCVELGRYASFPFALTGILDEKGQQFSSWAYDTQGRGISSNLGGALGANLTTLTYNSDGTVGGIDLNKPRMGTVGSARWFHGFGSGPAGPVQQRPARNGIRSAPRRL
jgi:hypothetical protein